MKYHMWGKINMKDAIAQVYKSKEELVILGLTGRTGAGCTTVAKILSTKSFQDLDIKDIKQYDFNDSDERKFKIIYDYMNVKERWQPFITIDVSGLILASALELGKDAFAEFINKITNEDQKKAISIGEKRKVLEKLDQMQYMFEDCQKFGIDKAETDIAVEEYYEFYTNTLLDYKKRFRSVFDSYSCYEIYKDKIKGKQQSKFHMYTYLMQQFGNNIRCSGNPFNDVFDENKYYNFARRIDKLIQIIIKYNEMKSIPYTRICIDAIRNPYEAMFLKDKYRAFYFVSICTDDYDRFDRLRNLTAEELANLDTVEYPQKMKHPQEVFFHQSIESCIEYAGIHIYNPNVSDEKYYKLTNQLVKYIALIIHPGLITPSHIERCMQLAYNSKFNSGCLSRQVGAVVTRGDFSVQAVGWNDVPKGQVPCLLRDTNTYCKNKDTETFSEYEIEDKKFSEAIGKLNECTKEKLYGHCMSYCFKDVYNSIVGGKNQVYTRALHAEENAFLQISKYGGTEVKGGYLFCTASPCELCAKKAYQLGIKNIYYINPYPGISKKYILTFGKEGNPKMYLFFGAIGQTYLDLYEPRIATKDELELLTDINVKKLISDKDSPKELSYADIKYENIEIDFNFIQGRNEIECFRNINAEILKEEITEFTRKIIWTGSSYDGTTLVKEESDADIEISETRNSLPYTYSVKAKRQKGQKLNYKLLTKVKDEKNVMEPYLAHMVKNRTDRLVLKVTCGVEKHIFKEVKAKVYADLEMNTLIDEKSLEEKQDDANKIYYEYVIQNANINYTYAIEWKF